jgi:glycosyltransferase involved in cell wall biosynthesis
MCPNVDFARGSADDYLFISEAMRLLNPSIVHLNALSGSAVIAAAKEKGIPIVCHVRNRPDDGYVEAFSYSSAVVAISRYIKAAIMQFGVSEDKIYVIHNEVDTQEFCRQQYDRQSIRRALGIDDDAKVILMVARLTPYKRHDVMISALPLIRAVVPSARVIALGEAYGEEEYVQGLEDRIDEVGLRDYFKFLPFHNDLRPLYVAADAFVLCSDGEPLGRSVVEALAMETPVVVTDSGGTSEIVRHNETGLIGRSGDAQSLAECLIKTLVDLDGCLARAHAGRAFVEAHLSARVTAEQMMSLYDVVRQV